MGDTQTLSKPAQPEVSQGRRILLNTLALGPIQGSTLFYPCSGNDWLLPIKLFTPYCNEFWFVDTGYFRTKPPEEIRPACLDCNGYTLLDKQVHYPDMPPEHWKDDHRYGFQPPPILTETYLHRRTGREIRVNRHRRRGPSALRKQIEQLGVFFYRGDSEGEGGSGTHWLTVREWHRRRGRRRSWLVHEMLDKLIDGGLLVTDGGMCLGEHNPYRELRRHRCNSTIGRQEAIEKAKPFTDDQGRRFCCIGCLGQHRHRTYGPAMVWQVRKPELGQ